MVDWIQGWKRRKTKTINGVIDVLTDYQKKLTFYKGSGTDTTDTVFLGGHCNNDFSDLRFTASDGTTTIPYWVEYYDSGLKAAVWLKIPYIPVSQSINIYIYYDNPTASPASSGRDTFDAYLGASDSTINDPGGLIHVDSDDVISVHNGLAGTNAYVYKNINPVTDFIMDFELKVDAVVENYDSFPFGFGISTSGTRLPEDPTGDGIYMVIARPGIIYFNNNRVTGGFIYYATATQLYLSFERRANLYYFSYNNDRDRPLNGNLGYISATTTIFTAIQALTELRSTASGHAYGSIGKMRIRKTFFQEPAWGVSGTEETFNSGYITFISVPAGAEILLDGSDTHRVTPATIASPVGTHNFALQLPCYETKTGTVDVYLFQTSTVTETLRKNTGDVNILSDPAGAAIWIDGIQQTPVTPATITCVLEGTHLVVLTLQGYQYYESDITVTAEQVSVVNAHLQRTGASGTGSIAVFSNPAGAAIYVDGIDTGQVTPDVVNSLSVGSHTVKVYKTGYNPESSSVTVVDNTTIEKHFTLTAVQAGDIVCSTTPVGAGVLLDGVDTGHVTPETLTNVPAGTHTVSFVKTGYEQCDVPVTVVTGSSVPAYCTLNPTPTTGSINCQTTPTGAAILLDSADTGQITDSIISNVSPGIHTVSFVKTGYEKCDIPVTVTAGQQSPASCALTPVSAAGNIDCTSAPSGAQIWLDSVDTGHITPDTLTGISAVNHNVTFKLSGYNDCTVQVTVTAGGSVPAGCQLTPSTVTHGEMEFRSMPSGASIMAAPAGQTPADTGLVTQAVITRPPGDYDYILRLSGFNDYIGTVTVLADQRVIVDVTLTPNEGCVYFSTDPQGAKIYLDGIDTGQVTPAEICNLALGEHTFRLVLDGYDEVTGTFTIVSGAGVTLVISMKRVGITSQQGSNIGLVLLAVGAVTMVGIAAASKNKGKGKIAPARIIRTERKPASLRSRRK